MSRLIEVASLALIALIAAILLGGTGGGIGHFSPETLVSKSRKQYLFAQSTECSTKLTGYLIEKGYWSPDTTKKPHWILMFEWSPGTRDGESALERELFSRHESWIEWSEKHPDLAGVLWPRVLSLLRSDDRKKGQIEAVTLLQELRWAKDLAHVEQVLEGPR